MEPGIARLRWVLDRLGLSSEAMSPLLAFSRQVQADADRLGLVSKMGARDLVARHVAESLAFALAAPTPPSAGSRWVDVGSGAGFPGIPLAIVFPQTRFTLIESQQRRAGFLEVVAEDLGLANVEVVAGRAQDAARSAEKAQVAVTRALSSREASGASPGTFSLLKALIEPGGAIIVQVAQGARSAEGTSLVRTALGDDGTEVAFLIMQAT